MKRTPLNRRTELRVVSPLQRGKPLSRGREGGTGTDGPAPRPVKRARDTGPPAAVKHLVLDRSGGCCEICGVLVHDGDGWVGEHSFHHRRPRRMGGSSDPATNRPSNLLLLCGSATSPAGCHLLVESQRALALGNGWLLHAEQNPTHEPVELAVTPPAHRTWLTDDGGITVADGGNTTWTLIIRPSF